MQYQSAPLSFHNVQGDSPMANDNEAASDPAPLIDESIRLELNVGNLYLLFHDLFPQDAPFWWHLAEEEKNHAALIRSGKEYFAPLDQFPQGMIHDNISELKEANGKVLSIIKECKAHTPSRAEALNFALAIEQSAGECHFQKFMDNKTDSPIDRIFRELNDGDAAHAKRITVYMEKNGISITPPVM